MKKKLWRVVSAILTLSMVLGLLSLSVSATDEPQDFNYSALSVAAARSKELLAQGADYQEIYELFVDYGLITEADMQQFMKLDSEMQFDRNNGISLLTEIGDTRTVTYTINREDMLNIPTTLNALSVYIASAVNIPLAMAMVVVADVVGRNLSKETWKSLEITVTQEYIYNDDNFTRNWYPISSSYKYIY